MNINQSIEAEGKTYHNVKTILEDSGLLDDLDNNTIPDQKINFLYNSEKGMDDNSEIPNKGDYLVFKSEKDITKTNSKGEKEIIVNKGDYSHAAIFSHIENIDGKKQCVFLSKNGNLLKGESTLDELINIYGSDYTIFSTKKFREERVTENNNFIKSDNDGKIINYDWTKLYSVYDMDGNEVYLFEGKKELNKKVVRFRGEEVISFTKDDLENKSSDELIVEAKNKVKKILEDASKAKDSSSKQIKQIIEDSKGLFDSVKKWMLGE